MSHAETIAAAIAEPDGEVRSLGTIPNRMESIRKLLKKQGPVENLRGCYEAARLAMCCTGNWQSWAFSVR